MRGQHREVALQSRCPKTLAAPQSTGAAQLGKHPVEIGHDEIEVRFAPISRHPGGWVSVRTFARESIFQHILEIPFKQSGLLGKILLDRPRRPRDIW
jgi:hypothetical protein